MKSSITIFCLFLSLLPLTITGLAQTDTATTTQKPHKAKTVKRKAPKSDADIQTCITERIAASPKLQGDSITPVVANRAATFNGTTGSAKNKNTVASLARKCGAARVTSNLEVQAAATKPAPKQ